MSLEVAIQENTQALKALLAHLQSGGAVAVPSEPAPPELAGGKTAKQAEEALAGHANAPAQAATYDDVKARVTEIAKKSREMAVAALQRFGVSKGPELKPAQYDEFVAYADQVLAGKINPIASH